MAGVPFWTLTLLNRAKSGTRPIAEALFAGLFALAALYITFNESSQNWQAVWTSLAYLLLGATLWQARFIAVAGTASKPVVLVRGDVQCRNAPIQELASSTPRTSSIWARADEVIE
jgi:hypothetical protein